MNKEFSRMQKLAGLITENMEVKDLKSITKDTINHYIDKSSSAEDREEYIINQHGLTDAGDIETVMNNVSAALRADAGDPMDEGVASYEYEMGKKAGEKEMGMEEGLNRRIYEMRLRKKIREMILAEMDGAAVEAGYYDPVAEAKKDEEEDVEVEDIEVTDDEMMGNDDPKVTKIQDLLNQLQDAAEELGDEKLLTQVGNTITFFTREHVANADNMG